MTAVCSSRRPWPSISLMPFAAADPPEVTEAAVMAISAGSTATVRGRAAPEIRSQDAPSHPGWNPGTVPPVEKTPKPTAWNRGGGGEGRKGRMCAGGGVRVRERRLILISPMPPGGSLRLHCSALRDVASIAPPPPPPPLLLPRFHPPPTLPPPALDSTPHASQQCIERCRERLQMER